MKLLRQSGLFLLLVLSVEAHSQLGPEYVRQAVKVVDRTALPSHIEEFYRINGYQLAWINHKDRMDQLVGQLRQCSDLGLNREAYRYTFIMSLDSSYASLKDLADSLQADLRITDAALHFFCEVKTGNRGPELRYNGLRYQPDCSDIPRLLQAHLQASNLPVLVSALVPRSREYREMQMKLARMNRVIEDSSFKEVLITSNQVRPENKPLLVKLYQLGVIDASHKPVTVQELTAWIKKAQKMFDALNDGVLRKTILAALNVPLVQRREELSRALNYLRWLNGFKNEPAAGLLNIPSASLLVYSKGSIILDSKVIVGKPSTPTPMLSSRITEVVLYPYWMVPQNIAVRELLPQIQRNRAYLAANNYQVLNKQGKVLDPASINWGALSARNFPYIIRQGTGCDNALGLVKFNFYNPFSVYWHDTPAKSLFFLNKRYFSHGCMRIEKAEELAHVLLNNNRIAIDTLTEKGCLQHQEPVVVPAEVKMPVMVIYSTVWYDKNGAVRFYDDVYRKGNY